ncbi:GntR family transcriptional regulator [Sulfobacillus thermosulfidooxidans]|uniref:GntR family transcriptional regulator n=1 Tax=Sulfobacillus thermosulfidooxidans TaxID=28034 RepID=UPI0006B5CFE6|nr:GntR family transcriptional regulator [Sulfobacillus thermosulfidooxidans]
MDIDKRPLQQEIYEKIKKRIILGEYMMGQQLVEQQLSHIFKVSRIPVRSALSMLENEGLVVNIPYRGHFVKPLTVNDIQEIYQFRYVIEAFSAELVSESNISLIVEQLEKSHREYCSTNLYSVLELANKDLEFHQIPIQAVNNSRLHKAWSNLQDEVMRVLCLASHPQTNDLTNVAAEHEKILLGYRNLNLTMIRDSLKEHFKQAQQRVIKQLEYIINLS